MLTTDPDTKCFKLVSLKDSGFKKRKWAELMTLEPDVSVYDFDGFESFIALYTSQGLTTFDLDTAETSTLSGFGVGKLSPGLNQEYRTTKSRFTFSTPCVLGDLYDYDHTTGQATRVKQS